MLEVKLISFRVIINKKGIALTNLNILLKLLYFTTLYSKKNVKNNSTAKKRLLSCYNR